MLRTAWVKAATVAALVATSVAVGGAARAGAHPAPDRGSPHTASRPAYDQTAFQADLAAVVASGAPGVLAEVDTGGQRLRGSDGVADLDAGGTVDPGGFFRAGSNTKPFIAVVVLQLAAEHRLSLADTVQRWLPGVVTGNGNDGGRITVRQLLQHTSGLHNYADDLAARIDSVEAYRTLQFEQFAPRELIGIALDSAPDFAPGTNWNYSNTNYVLLGQIIQKVTGRPWATEVRDRIIRPLGLRHTFAPGMSTALPQPHSSAYLYLGPDTPLETSTESVSWADAAGSLITTTADLTRFWSALGRGLLLLLPPAQQRQMRQTVLATTFQDDQPGLRYGLGLNQTPLSCGGFYWGHDGDVPGYSTVSGVSEDGRTTVVISMNVTADTPQHRAAWTMADHAFCSAQQALTGTWKPADPDFL